MFSCQSYRNVPRSSAIQNVLTWLTVGQESVASTVLRDGLRVYWWFWMSILNFKGYQRGLFNTRTGSIQIVSLPQHERTNSFDVHAYAWSIFEFAVLSKYSKFSNMESLPYLVQIMWTTIHNYTLQYKCQSNLYVIMWSIYLKKFFNPILNEL